MIIIYVQVLSLIEKKGILYIDILIINFNQLVIEIFPHTLLLFWIMNKLILLLHVPTLNV